LKLSAEYDRWHQAVGGAGVEEADGSSPWYKLVLEYLPDIRGKRILEVACGRGGFLRVLSSMGADVYGADFSSSALAIGRQKLQISGPGRTHLVQADAHFLPFPDSFFDFVVSCETIEHLVQPLRAIADMARVTKPGALLFLTTPNYANLMGLYQLYDRLLRRNRHSEASQPLDRAWVFFQVRGLVKKAGWRILRSDGTIHQVPIRGKNPIRIERLEANRRVRRLLRCFALHYMLVARKESTAAAQSVGTAAD
jgi:ubiquinone/menaquinone biosynthesis C-methylase UbiE